MSELVDEAVRSKVQTGLTHIWEGTHIIKNAFRHEAKRKGVEVPGVQYLDKIVREIDAKAFEFQDLSRAYGVMEKKYEREIPGHHGRDSGPAGGAQQATSGDREGAAKP